MCVVVPLARRAVIDMFARRPGPGGRRVDRAARDTAPTDGEDGGRRRRPIPAVARVRDPAFAGANSEGPLAVGRGEEEGGGEIGRREVVAEIMREAGIICR